MSVQAFTDPDPLPQGGSGWIYILLNVGNGRFLTRGSGDTFVKPPRKAGPISLGNVEWPPPSGNFRHPESGRPVRGWTGQVFVKIPAHVSSKAPLGPVSFKIDFQYRVLSVSPPIAGMINVDPIEFQARIGPPLPQVVFPDKPVSKPGTSEKGPAGKKAGGNTAPPPKAPPGATRERKTPGKALPGKAGKSPGKGREETGFEDTPILPGSGGFLANAPLVLGAAGLLVLIALLILFKGNKGS